MHTVMSKDVRVGDKIRRLWKGEAETSAPIETVREVSPHPQRPGIITVLTDHSKHHSSDGYEWELNPPERSKFDLRSARL